MRKLLLILVVTVAAPALAGAGGVEITALGGYTFPLFSQTLSYNPGPVSFGVDMSVEQSGSFKLKGSGSTAFAGAVAFFPAEAVGFELRVDSVGMKVKATEASYRVRAILPSPLPAVEETLELADGTATVDSVRPWSLNLKLRTTGSSKVFASGGISRLGNVDVSAEQEVSLGLTRVDFQTGTLELRALDVRAERPEDVSTASWGGNLGLGFEVPIGERGGIVFEGRGFYFPKREYGWATVGSPSLNSVEQQLLGRLLERLPVVEFEPWWVQASVGLTLRF